MGLITPQGDAGYTGKVNALLGVIRTNPVGDLILTSITKPVIIAPVSAKPSRKGAKEASTEPDQCDPSVIPADRDAASAKLKKPGEPGYDKERDQYYIGQPGNRRETYKNRLPTGAGSASTLYFTPGDHGACSSNRKRRGRSEPESTLVHELVHCLRMSQGLIRAVPTTTNEFVNEEEFLAIVIANVYKSVRDGSAAVLDHSHAANDIAGGAEPDFDTSVGFVDDPHNLEVLKYHANWVTFKAIAKLKTSKNGRPQDIIFNPFAEYESRAQAKAASKRTPVGAGK